VRVINPLVLSLFLVKRIIWCGKSRALAIRPWLCI
jgi:hypothetical protein